MAKSFDVASIKAAINAELKRAEAVVTLAEQESRELTEQDRVEIDARMAAIGVDGEEPTGLYEDLSRATKLEDVAAQMAVQEHNAIVGSAASKPAPTLRALGYRGQSLPGFSGPDAERNAYHAGMWLRAMIRKDPNAIEFCQNHGMSIYAQQVEGVDADGGYLVPAPLSDAIWEIRNTTGLARQVCDVVPMTSDVLNIPKLTAGPTVYYPSEAASITASKATFGTIALSVKRSAILVKMSNQLIQDSIVDVASRIASRAGYELSYTEDGEFINGDGTSTYGGETGVDSALGAGGKVTLGSGDTTWSTVTLADLNELVAKLPSAYTPQASFIMHRQFYSSTVQRLLYAAGGNSTDSISGPTSTGESAFLFGYPVRFTDQMPADSAGNLACLFGSWSQAVVLGDRSAIEIGVSAEFAFDEDVTTLRATSRSDLAVHDPGDGSDAGGYVGMYLAAS